MPGWQDPPHSLTFEEIAEEVWEDESPAPGPRRAEVENHHDLPGTPRQLLDLPIGIDRSGCRIEHDSLGSVEVPADRYWGPQTQRSLEHFSIGTEHMPIEVYHAYGHVKKATAMTNVAAGALPEWKGSAIIRVCDEILAGSLDEHFPLSVFQTGSGTHTNANVNEVIANRGNQLFGTDPGSNSPASPE